VGNETYVDDRYPLSALTARIIAAAQEVHRILGLVLRKSSINAPG